MDFTFATFCLDFSLCPLCPFPFLLILPFTVLRSFPPPPCPPQQYQCLPFLTVLRSSEICRYLPPLSPETWSVPCIIPSQQLIALFRTHAHFTGVSWGDVIFTRTPGPTALNKRVGRRPGEQGASPGPAACPRGCSLLGTEMTAFPAGRVLVRGTTDLHGRPPPSPGVTERTEVYLSHAQVTAPK